MDRRNKKVRHFADESYECSLPVKEGNGTIRYHTRKNVKGEIVRYSFTYINHYLCTVDNGRALGFDNSHGWHHRHFMGAVEAFNYRSHDELEAHFEIEWRKLHEQAKNLCR